MCVKKLKIPNLGFDKHDVLSTPFVYVNCGHCWQCRLERSNGFTFRVLQEVLQSNCVPFFVTLTYNDTYLPYLEFVYEGTDFQDHYAKISCWNRTHVQRFHKRVRRSLQYYYGIDSDSFKYLCSCERGSDKEYVSASGRKRIATKRPHYHIMYMLFVPDTVLPIRALPDGYYTYLMANQITDNFSSFFRYLLVSNWFYGHIDDVAFCRDVVAATSYVTKYLTKDLNEGLFNIPVTRLSRLIDKDYEDRYERWRQRNINKLRFDWSIDQVLGYTPYCPYSPYPKPIKHTSLFPRSFGSINLGLSFLNDKSVDELFNYFVGLKKVTLPFVKSSSLINLPYYYFRKCCKSIQRLHDNRYYKVNRLLSGIVKSVTLYTFPRKSNQIFWDNVHGLTIVSNNAFYTISVTSDFGKKCLRYRKYLTFLSFLNFYQTFKKSLPYYKSVLDSYLSLDNVYQSCVPGISTFQFTQLKDTTFVNLFKRLVVYMHDKSSSDVLLSNLLNFYQLCQFTKSHLSHLAYELKYRNKLGQSALDNPDLFLSHYF